MLTIEQTRCCFGACEPAVDVDLGGIFGGYFRSLAFLIFPLGGTF